LLITYKGIICNHGNFTKEAKRILKNIPVCLIGFQSLPKPFYKWFKERTGIHITPQVLREFFCQQMGELGIPDRYIDAFCGRVPKSILARHYTDYSPERLKRIYDKANLRILS